MSRRTIYLLAVLLFLAALLYWAGDKLAPPPETAIPELFFAAPSDAESLIYVDLAALRRSPFIAQLLALVPPPEEDKDYRDFILATGFDYSRDLDRLLIALWPSRPGAPATKLGTAQPRVEQIPPGAVFAVAEGRFNREKIAAYALRAGKLEKQHGLDVYVVPAGASSRTVSFAFPAPNRMALTNSSVLTVGAGWQASATMPPDQRDRLLRSAGGAIIAVTKIDATRENFSFFGFRSRELAKLLRNFRSIALAARPAGALLKVALEGECASPADARDVGKNLEALRLLARVLLSDSQTRRQLSPQVLAVADVIVRNGEVLVTDNRVQLRFELTPATLGSSPAQR